LSPFEAIFASTKPKPKPKVKCEIPLFLDSPMSAAVTTLYLNHHQEHQLSVSTCRKMFQRVNFIESQEEFKLDYPSKGIDVYVRNSFERS
jgi:hypothetical protein